MMARDAGLWVGTLLIAPFLAALAIKLILPKRKLLVSGRAIFFLVATLALGPGLWVNVVLEGSLGPAAPDRCQTVRRRRAFHGVVGSARRLSEQLRLRFGRRVGRVLDRSRRPFWRRRPGGRLRWAPRLTLGAGMAAMRMMAGAHFASDVIFRRRVHVPDYLDRAWPDLSLAAHAPRRRNNRTPAGTVLGEMPARIVLPATFAKQIRFNKIFAMAACNGPAGSLRPAAAPAIVPAIT